MAGKERERWEWKEPYAGRSGWSGKQPWGRSCVWGVQDPPRAPDPPENLHPAGWGCCRDAAAWPGRRWGCQRLSLPIHHRCRLDHITGSSQVGPALSALPGGCGEVVPAGLSG